MKHTFISEQEAAELLGYAPYTLRLKVTGTGRYTGKEPLPITFTTGGKGYRYSKEDIEQHLLRRSSFIAWFEKKRKERRGRLF